MLNETLHFPWFRPILLLTDDSPGQPVLRLSRTSLPMQNEQVWVKRE